MALAALLLAFAAPPSSLFQYNWTSGALDAVADVAPASHHTVASAEALCTKMPLCGGFTYVGDNSTSPSRLTKFKAFFGGLKYANATENTTSTWAKIGVLTPPALTVEVGTSNLELQLRASAFTVQSLGPTTDPWSQPFSFVRALATSSTLPGQVHVGDVTIRLLQTKNPEPATPGCTSSGWATYSSAVGIGPDATPIKPMTQPTMGGDDTGGVATKFLAAHDISALLARSAPNGSDPFPLTVTRTYEVSEDSNGLVMRFEISLPASAKAPATIGGLGFPMPENPGHQPSAIETSVWTEAHIGGDHGFVEYVRVVDDEATLLVSQEPGHNCDTQFEAWRPLLEDTGPGGWNNEWVVHSAAWAEDWACNRQHPFMDMAESYKKFYPEATRQTPWPSADGTESMPRLATAKDPWLKPTSKVLQPGDAMTVAFRLQRAPNTNSDPSNISVTGPGPRTRNTLLESIGEPVLHGVPGYVLSSEMKSAQLLVLPPAGATVAGATAESVGAGGGVIKVGVPGPVPKSRGFVSIPLSVTPGDTRGRVRVSVAFSDGTVAMTHYYVLPPFSTQVQRLGNHMAHVAWLPRDYPDPFGRGASVLPWDRALGKHVMDDARAYDVGLSDDAGGGNPLCLASKVHASPRQDQVTQVDEFIKWTLYGIKTDTAKPPFKSLQVGGDPATGCQSDPSSAHVDCDGIRMTMYYYARECDLHSYCKKYNCTLPPNNTSGHWPWNYTEVEKCSGLGAVHPWCMDEKMSNATYRAFNYPHHTASYWAMYHVARHYDKLTTHQPWQWYLERAAKTALRFSCGTGVMDGTVFREVLDALKAEGTLNTTIAGWATKLDTNMRNRQNRWARQRFPYGSEFAFDTTGQEEVVVWNLYYGNMTAAKATVDHILSYMRSIPSWAYNGGARAADSGNGGKYLVAQGSGKPDRGQMHYRSGLNMIPLLEWYRANPEDNFFLLEIAMGSIGGQLTNIDETGATSMFYHVYPWVMDFDPHSGDYGLGFFGNALESGAYFVTHPRLGPLCFLCTASENKATGVSTITPEDAYHRRVFVEPLALYLVAIAGVIARVEVEPLPSRKVSLVFNATEFGETPWSKLRLSIKQTSAAAQAGAACSITHDGKAVAPVATDNSTYAFSAMDGKETTVLLSC